ncbi:hypothetical protein A3D00_02955 [Candidatus Woesebacteria bacterium RIFCSPHIGHO2_02_FULL_38_9]|uniref:Uncharacterized protein n=1 Tax=Candidatus Woesebacteria bacterium RIFCSPHIGHO2_01_FULL_39_28 TaxID=1802496 RepID=A0A1F7YHU1_9BACT|nr:MAG: hypothetical protein A2627_03910 [Candidatus Woesebacteria bacterium RIFCSPHIGHO2_01_FULL_39_28]OGM35342.1 MAG: hypothetical protein A3D00_02955 [Candidatus Woesebacteria bacterium RIFCSPHIGHO2_02_FULL_38_9]
MTRAQAAGSSAAADDVPRAGSPRNPARTMMARSHRMVVAIWPPFWDFCARCGCREALAPKVCGFRNGTRAKLKP